MNEINIPIEKSIHITTDNESAIALSKNPEFHARTKHINVAYHFQRYKMQKGIVKFVKIPSEDMAAGGLTKPLPKIKFERFLQFINMVD
jgi:hypothetical protein